MILNLKNEIERRKADDYFEYLMKKQSKIELKIVRKKRTFKQNAYLHLILSWFALEYGETKEYVKQDIFKKTVNSELFKTIFHNKKQGTNRVAWRSSASLNTLEMTNAIDRFRNYSSKEAGIYLPEANETEYLNHIEEEIKRYGNAEYL